MAFELFGYPGLKLLAVILEIGNIGLLLGLLYLYIKSYRQIKIGFTAGLILFALMLLLKSFASIGFMLFAGNVPGDMGYIVMSLIQFIALAVLLKITWDY